MSDEEATEDAELLMLFGSEDLIAYNVKNKGVRKPKSFGIKSNYQVIPLWVNLGKTLCLL